MDRDEERRIIAQVCAGDANAFEALVVAYQKQVYNLALRTVGSEEDAADMTQEVFLRAYRALGTFCAAAGGTRPCRSLHPRTTTSSRSSTSPPTSAQAPSSS